MNSIDSAIVLVMMFEGFQRKPYIDAAGKPTIGYGTTVYPNGKRVKITDKPISKETALIYVKHDLGIIQDRLSSIPNFELLNENQKAALYDLAYNVGFMHIITGNIGLYISLKEFSRVPNIILQYNKAHVNGKLKILNGLTRRREEEVKLYREPVTDNK